MKQIVRRRSYVEHGPFDYTAENYTTLLWVMEGFTTYYDILLMRRSGLVSEERYLETLAERITLYLSQPGRLVQSLEEASFTTWIKFYRPDENYVNSGISYYLKGAMVALLLDLRIRWTSRNSVSLDDLMHRLWNDFGKHDVGFTEEEFHTLLGEYLDDVPRYVARYVRGTEELPLKEHLLYAGISLDREQSEESTGGYLGIRMKDTATGVKVSHVLADSPALRAGLMPEDHLLALEGYAIRDQEWLKARLRERKPDEKIQLHFFRYGELQTRTVTLGLSPPGKTHLTHVPDPAPLQRDVYESWLCATWDTELRDD